MKKIPMSFHMYCIAHHCKYRLIDKVINIFSKLLILQSIFSKNIYGGMFQGSCCRDYDGSWGSHSMDQRGFGWERCSVPEDFVDLYWNGWEVEESDIEEVEKQVKASIVSDVENSYK